MPTNHSKRIAYISVKIARELRLTNEEIFDLASLAIMHDNGASMKILYNKLLGTTKEKMNVMESRKGHCIIGENNLKEFPFLTNPQNVIKYHHEKYDGSGFFGLSKDEIPLLAQIIALADTLDLVFDLRNVSNKEIITAFVHEHRNTFFSPLLADVFLKIADHHEFWEALVDKNIDDSLKKVIPIFSHELNYNEIRTITKTFSNIIDAQSEFTQKHSSGLSEKLEKMAEFYKMDKITTLKLLIATDLHDLGKLVISSDLLDKPGELTEEEFEEIKKHPKITKSCLQDISGFEEITKWASNHHEKLDGSGYPEGLMAKDLDFNSRLIACLDIYQALREDRPYRKSMDHNKAMEILNGMVGVGELDHTIVDDINSVFSNL
ncbi:MAG: HD domain-containing protein [Peptostreptococcaceae bacterium]|nr:HD domain-containing protein [Peptostreptococcaceae bacterium]